MRDFNRGPSGARLGIILAGGKATRLGPMTTTMSKALVPVGSRPQVVNQALMLRDAGCGQVIVITSSRTNEQVEDVIKYAGLGSFVRTVIQPQNLMGPVGAILAAAMDVQAQVIDDVFVLMSDTVIGALPRVDFSWVGVHHITDRTRSWCVGTRDGFVDRVPEEDDELLTIGAYYFHDGQKFGQALHDVRWLDDGETPMAPFLNAYVSHVPTAQVYNFSDWKDVGDTMSLIRANTGDGLIARAHHTLTVGNNLVTKSGVSPAEASYMLGLKRQPVQARALFPQVYEGTDTAYTMEFIDLPTLAELWMYHPMLASTWDDIFQRIISQVGDGLWWSDGHVMQAGAWLADKVWDRHVGEFVLPFPNTTVSALEDIVGEDIVLPVGHGDLNFSNILFSPTTGVTKLIDPRGTGTPSIYEYAKLAYSPRFVAITHGLPEVTRPEAEAKLMSRLGLFVDERRLKATMALTMMAAPPLHPPSERPHMYEAAKQWAEEALG